MGEGEILFGPPRDTWGDFKELNGWNHVEVDVRNRKGKGNGKNGRHEREAGKRAADRRG
jgi:hypothetical protein